jgi:CBS domain protein
MAPGHSDRPVDLPVRSLLILERDGRRERALRVLCPRRHASIDTRVCTTCSFAHRVSEAAVTCAASGIPEGPESAPDRPLVLGPDALSLRTPVGAVCALHSVAVRVDMPIAHARKLLDRHAVVVVLTADDRVHGVLSAAEPPEGLTALVELESRTRELPESAPLIEAIELMVHRHVRLVSVTADDGHFVGLVADLDVLRWVARRRLTPAP